MVALNAAENQRMADINAEMLGENGVCHASVLQFYMSAHHSFPAGVLEHVPLVEMPCMSQDLLNEHPNVCTVELWCHLYSPSQLQVINSIRKENEQK